MKTQPTNQRADSGRSACASVAQIFNLLYRGFATRTTLAESDAPENFGALPIRNRRYSAARPNRNPQERGRPVRANPTPHAGPTPWAELVGVICLSFPLFRFARTGYPRSGKSSRPAYKGNDQRAFSLLELMVSVAILAIIIVGLLAMFNQVHRAFKSGTAQVDVMEGGRAASGIMGRELQELTATPLTNGVNLFTVDVLGSMPVVQPLTAGGQRENKLMDLSFMTRVNDEWIGISYRVANTNVNGSANYGAGTLYRLIATAPAGNDRTDLLGPTNVVLLSSNLVLSSPVNTAFDLATGLAGQCARTNYHRVIDGVVHFLVTAYDHNGVEMAEAWYPNPNQGNNAIGFACSNSLVPAFVDFELGVLEPSAMAKFNARIDPAPGEPTVALEYLKKNAGKVHLFRQRIAIRSAATTPVPGS